MPEIVADKEKFWALKVRICETRYLVKSDLQLRTRRLLFLYFWKLPCKRQILMRLDLRPSNGAGPWVKSLVELMSFLKKSKLLPQTKKASGKNQIHREDGVNSAARLMQAI